MNSRFSLIYITSIVCTVFSLKVHNESFNTQKSEEELTIFSGGLSTLKMALGFIEV